MMNVECDVTIGPILRRLAENAGVVYSWAAGDEPAAILELHRFANALGFEIVAAGKGKNNPLHHEATPDTERAKAEARKMSARMLCEFVDGSKTAVEMAAVSNATGLVPDVRGDARAALERGRAHPGIRAQTRRGRTLAEGRGRFRHWRSPRGLPHRHHRQPAHPGGSGTARHGQYGPYYTLFRPFHLCSIEVPLTLAQCVLYGESSGHSRPSLVSECIAVAKRDFKPGEVLDGIGEFCYRGSIDLAAVARRERLVPLGLAKGCVVKRPVAKGEVIGYDDLEALQDSVLLQLRRIQDQLYA